MTDLLTHAIQSALEDFFAAAPEGTDVPVRREATHRRRTAAPILAAIGATGTVAAGIVAIAVTTSDRAGDSSAGSAPAAGERLRLRL